MPSDEETIKQLKIHSEKLLDSFKKHVERNHYRSSSMKYGVVAEPSLAEATSSFRSQLVQTYAAVGRDHIQDVDNIVADAVKELKGMAGALRSELRKEAKRNSFSIYVDKPKENRLALVAAAISLEAQRIIDDKEKLSAMRGKGQKQESAPASEESLGKLPLPPVGKGPPKGPGRQAPTRD